MLITYQKIWNFNQNVNIFMKLRENYIKFASQVSSTYTMEKIIQSAAYDGILRSCLV